MKKFLTLLLITAILLTLTACHTYLFGEYINEETGYKYEFMNNEFTLTKGENVITGTYTIKNKTIIFKYDDNEITYSYERNGTNAIIDNVIYTRGQ
ncbi:MAG TPA: hypothetical protein PLT91_03645 [Clostridia bacterium]|jgi:hypothetical protein|nr:MAG: hypothetical protein BWX97_00762 [Firmicutes bacterium ADurb.Bin146]HOD93854.1 hypothetical protein [Clostridia bacterium]HQM39315.1 hypothetical protein [Clostridia bacterium]